MHFDDEMCKELKILRKVKQIQALRKRNQKAIKIMTMLVYDDITVMLFKRNNNDRFAKKSRGASPRTLTITSLVLTSIITNSF